MALISDLPAVWSAPVVLAATEVWQPRGGPVWITTDPAEATAGGIELRDGEPIKIGTGKSVRYRSFSYGTQIARIAVE